MKKFIILLALLTITSYAYTTTINIPTDYITIQAGIGAASDSDTVLVEPGTYPENINFNGKNITLASLYFTTQDTSYISQTIIDVSHNGSVVTFENGEDSTAFLVGFTLQKGNSDSGGGICCDESSPSLENLVIKNNVASSYGGGISCKNNSNPVLKNIIITNNISTDDGGGIYCDESSPSLENVTISNNTASVDGGGIYCYWGSSSSLVNVTISNNTVTGEGGGIYFSGSSPSLVNVEITDNSATGDFSDGGGLYCHSSDPSLENVTISNNTASVDGGGIYCYWGSSPSLVNVTISNNTASVDGGGINCFRSDPSLVDVTISNNTAADDGGGIYCVESDPSLVNVTISNNTADDDGGGIYCYESSSLTITNSIVSHNTGHYGINVNWDSDALITYSDFYNNEDGNFDGCGNLVGVNSTTNANGDSCDVYDNIQLKPCFVDTANGNYHLTVNSPCIDAGNPNSPPDPDGTVADMGAYYFDNSPGTIEGNVTIIDGGGDFGNVIIQAENQSTTPDVNGYYSLEIEPGTYTVIASLQDYNSQQIQNVVVQGGELTSGIDFNLELISLTNLNAMVKNYNDILLSWEEPNIKSMNVGSKNFSKNIRGYKVYRDNVEIHQIYNPSTIEYTDNSLDEGSYEYEVTVILDNGESAAVSATVEINLLPPSNLTIQLQEEYAIATWSPPSNKFKPDFSQHFKGLLEYNVYLDGDLLNSISDTTYQYGPFTEFGNHEASISIVYDGGFESETVSKSFVYDPSASDLRLSNISIPETVEWFGGTYSILINNDGDKNLSWYIEFGSKDLQYENLRHHNQNKSNNVGNKNKTFRLDWITVEPAQGNIIGGNSQEISISINQNDGNARNSDIRFTNADNLFDYEIVAVKQEGVSSSSELADAFTPNGDGINDEFIIGPFPEKENTEVQLKIFNKHGINIYSSKGDSQEPICWDGKNESGNVCRSGAYIYIYYLDGAPYKKSIVYLVR